ncbi:MAG: nickel-type superoxide dismutase maturation protease [Actinomycetota bacterium]|nr:nickel-type superoxide dismutase maturation protease [Actinomycetota bacterium]
MADTPWSWCLNVRNPTQRQPAGLRPAARIGAAIARACTAVTGVGALAVVGCWAWWRPRRVQVEGPSMLPSLHPGDRLLVVRRHGLPLRGQIVALHDPSCEQRLLVKRVAAVGPNGVTVLGDNAGASTDSRSWGPVPPGSLLGEAVYRYAPAARVGRLPVLLPAVVRG